MGAKFHDLQIGKDFLGERLKALNHQRKNGKYYQNLKYILLGIHWQSSG